VAETARNGARPGFGEPAIDQKVCRLRRTLAEHLNGQGVWFDSRAWIVTASQTPRRAFLVRCPIGQAASQAPRTRSIAGFSTTRINVFVPSIALSRQPAFERGCVAALNRRDSAEADRQARNG
jgi:hypothetical protein